ncbi:hypothetical protein [Oryzomonas japonica]|uniref:hypothetical protein n=1 Tax=Oryzomonas japonica TaxID=2603858 RepID=UPI0017847651|nr:hypothetical protein [Oryzomonas japonica]
MMACPPTVASFDPMLKEKRHGDRRPGRRFMGWRLPVCRFPGPGRNEPTRRI